MPRVTISEPGKTPQPYRFKLERKIVKIGRSNESDIIIDCGSASTNHCTMERVDGGYILRDNDSTNGIKQDDTLMSVIDLFDGMQVLIGDVPMKFQLSESEIQDISEEEFSTHQKKKLPTSHPHKNEVTLPRKTSPSPNTSRSQRPLPTVQKNTPPMNAFVVFILMIVAIVAGLTIRHYKETGNILPVIWMEGKSGKLPADTAIEKALDEEENE